MVTEHDITTRLVAEGRNPARTKVREVMTPEVRYVFEDEDLGHVAEAMAAQQVRRLPVVNRDKRLVGMVSFSDLPKARWMQAERALGGGTRENKQRPQTTAEIAFRNLEHDIGLSAQLWQHTWLSIIQRSLEYLSERSQEPWVAARIGQTSEIPNEAESVDTQPSSEEDIAQEIGNIIKRLEVGIAKEQKAMSNLLSRLRFRVSA